MKIELRNICKSFNKKTNTIDNMNLTINDGEFVALLGPSGCGKSTTMLMIAGIYKPDRGEIYFDGQIVNDLEPKDRNIGMVFQSYALYPHMTVLDNIAFPLKQQKVPKEERIKRAKRAAEMVQLEHLLGRKPSELSGGQQQRVALARAIVKRPKVLLLDEPMSNLDARLKIEMREEISRIQRELGITTILVTHDQEEAMTMADRIAVMKEGQIIQYDTPMELYYNPKNYFIAQFIGTPPMNFLKGKLLNNQLHLPNSTVELDCEFWEFNRKETEVHVGIRPYDLKLGKNGNVYIKGTVSMVELVGHSKMISVKVGNEQVRFFAEPNISIEYGSVIEISTQTSSIHLFDAVTGRSLKKDGMNKGLVKESVYN
ncbi:MULTISPECIES: ABC transporter ATP-binding protein [unclassified Geobacillus]|jgi:inositol-phosphate transport system ATP-binding protein|uniref:ABC transporter ATP-binding protein n=2 Tax=Geobacillus TaxID=129337 RepID=UPI00148D774D|nr:MULTISPECIES: ABC transporter ATP-binding protein [unclassified Geobacillus]NNU88885.1 ABC transporter ATP-binding protein [Geobacillus sp. MR]QNU31521.1 ABC transporter ATP-binding protein [Geobacillus sp. 47C-IIb]